MTRRRRDDGPMTLAEVNWTPPEPPPEMVERWQREAERRAAGPRLTAEQHRLAVWLRTALNRIPSRYRPDTADQSARRFGSQLRTAAEQWTPGVGWLILGPTASGKTSAAAYALVRRIGALLARPTPSAEATALCGLVWVSAAALCAARARWPLGRGESPEVERAIAAPVLVVDDVGWERDPSVLADVLAARYDAGRGVVATTGRPFADLASTDVYGAAVARRLAESAPGAMVTNLWPPKGQSHA